ncbi:MAG: lysophospholipase [Rickettsiales bacterium]|nr:lysophospholipase [Rickettsiales bacterium]
MQSKYFESFDKTRIAYIANIVPDSRAVLIIHHGLTEHKGRYADFMSRLGDAGISSLAFDFRGHGKSGGKRGDIRKFSDLISDLNLFIAMAKKEFPHQKVILFGHSMGGLVASEYAARHTMIDALILSSPSFFTAGKLKLLRFLPIFILRKIYIKKTYAESAEALAFALKDENNTNRFALSLVKIALVNPPRRIIRNLKNIRVPLLLLGGAGDPLVKSGRFSELMKRFGTSDKTLKIYKNAKHRIVQNESAEESAKDIIGFITRY